MFTKWIVHALIPYCVCFSCNFFLSRFFEKNLEIRLQGGRYKWEGHLQVRLNGGDWGAICSDYWTLREAMVACNQLSEYGKAKQALMV